MDKDIVIIGNPVTIVNLYIALLNDDGFIDVSNTKSNTKISHGEQSSDIKSYRISKDDNNNIQTIRYDVPELSIKINIDNDDGYIDTVFMDCNEITAENLQTHVETLVETIDHDNRCVTIIHPTAKSIRVPIKQIKNNKRYHKKKSVINEFKTFKCISLPELRSIIEATSVYSAYACIEDVFRDEVRYHLSGANELNNLAEQNPTITFCCAEKEIVYPDFVYIKSSEEITDAMTAVSIDTNFVQSGSWRNIKTIKIEHAYDDEDDRDEEHELQTKTELRGRLDSEEMPISQKSTSTEPCTRWIPSYRQSDESDDGIEYVHICQFDYTGIDTLIISGMVGCNDQCFINVPNIIFLYHKSTHNLSDFCKNNATVVRFNHECYAENGEELIRQALDIISSMRVKKNPTTIK